MLLDGNSTSSVRLPRKISFLTSQGLYDEFPFKDIHTREKKAVEKYQAIFIIGMGWPMSDGSQPEEIKSPDYDDWHLNGDIIVCHPLTEYRHKISSMGIRVIAVEVTQRARRTGPNRIGLSEGSAGR